MFHELFVIERKPELDDGEKDRVAYLRDKLSTVKGLGLDAQAASIKTDIATIERGRLIATPPMTDAELTIWRAWLPTAYIESNGPRVTRSLAWYDFDRIPGPVLKMWKKHKESGLFESFEIWTPEDHSPDPILVGVNGNAYHLLARWGESDANLVSFDDIKRELVSRWYRGAQISGEWTPEYFHPFFLTALGSMFIFAATMVGLTFLPSPERSVWLAVLIAAIGGVITFVVARRWEVHKRLRSSNLMKAIAKDNSTRREMLPDPA